MYEQVVSFVEGMEEFFAEGDGCLELSLLGVAMEGVQFSSDGFFALWSHRLTVSFWYTFEDSGAFLLESAQVSGQVRKT